MLEDRKYKPSLVDAAIRRARAIQRAQALKKVVLPPHSKRPIFAVTDDPRLPDLQSLQRKHWRSMIQDQYLKSVFPEPPLIAFRKQKNIADFLIRARLPLTLSSHPKRKINGMKKCGKQYLICSYVKDVKVVEGLGFKWHINKNMNCKSSSNIIYVIVSKGTLEKHIEIYTTEYVNILAT